MGGDGHHPHYVFEPPFNKLFVGILVWGGVGIGAGLIVVRVALVPLCVMLWGALSPAQLCPLTPSPPPQHSTHDNTQQGSWKFQNKKQGFTK